MHNNFLVEAASDMRTGSGFRVAACGPRITSGAGLPGMTGDVIPAKAGIQDFVMHPVLTLFLTHNERSCLSARIPNALYHLSE